VALVLYLCLLANKTLNDAFIEKAIIEIVIAFTIISFQKLIIGTCGFGNLL
jgi:hypothetical protein